MTGDLPPAEVAPYAERLVEHARSGPLRANDPGHHGGIGAPDAGLELLGRQVYDLDLAPLIPGVDTGPGSALELAERMAARAWGARRTWFLRNGASQGNLAACLSLAPAGRRVLVQRNVHISTVEGLTLSGLEPEFVMPETDPALGIAHCVTADAVAEALANRPADTGDVAGVIVVSPSYHGMAADVKAIAGICHRHGVPLIVDEAWGSHFRFHPGLPADALGCGADLVISSTHKTLGSLGQSAMLHLGRDSLIPRERVTRAIEILNSTTPSPLLAASLDVARARAEAHGRAGIDRSIGALAEVRERIGQMAGLEVLGRDLIGSHGIRDLDVFRVAVDLTGTGLDGLKLKAVLRDRFGLHAELGIGRTLVFVFGIGCYREDHADFVDRLRKGVKSLAGEAASGRPVPAAPLPGTPVISPRDAFLSRSEHVPLEAASGRISADTLSVYPPGIATILPGEAFTDEIIVYLRETGEAGAVIKGASDPGLESVRVVR